MVYMEFGCVFCSFNAYQSIMTSVFVNISTTLGSFIDAETSHAVLEFVYCLPVQSFSLYPFSCNQQAIFHFQY